MSQPNRRFYIVPNDAPATSEATTPTESVPVLDGVIVEPAKPRQIPAPAKEQARPAGKPMSPADSGRLRYAVSVIGHGTVKTPVATWDRFWDWAKLAPMRAGGTHRGDLLERHQQAYVTIQAKRGDRAGQVAKVAAWPWCTRAKVGKFPVALGAWSVTVGEVAHAAFPTHPLLAAVGLLNGLLGQLLVGAATLAAPVAAPVAAVAATAAVGHSVKVEHRRRKATLQAQQDEQAAATGPGGAMAAIPLADCDTPEEVAEATNRNLAIEKIQVKPLAARHVGWGWEVVVQLRQGKPADISNKLGELETLFDVAENGVLMQPHRDRRAQVTMRLIESDPWADMPKVPDYTTGPRRVSDPIWLGQRLDGVPVASAFNGKQSIILAASGGGKSILLRLIADGGGAAEDVHLWDLDPSGVGQASQARLMGKVALTPEDVEVALTQALAIASARTRLLRKLDMGDAWVASPKRPALGILLDEFPRLTPLAKATAVALLRIARKAGLYLVFATQDNKGKTLGESIAGQVAFKAGGPGLIDWQADLLWGPACKGRGWDPGRYQPATSQDQPNDAGTFFISGTGAPGGDLALPTKVGFMSGDTAKARAERYVQLGRCPLLDEETLRWAGLTPEEVYTHTDVEAAGAAQLRPAPDDNQDEQELPEEAVALLKACATAFTDASGEWIPVDAIVDLAVAEFGWPKDKATEMKVADLLDAACVAKDRKRIGGQKVMARLRAGLLAAAERSHYVTA